jgi:hypothetical protein
MRAFLAAMPNLTLNAGSPTLDRRDTPPKIVDPEYLRKPSRGKYKPSSGVQCPECRVTLSKGDCLNRMCKRFIGGSK